ncbi:MAG TPA: hypothetical protein VMV18_03935, partial [bacterium]|nr:hypothetical protein [bacterium]
AVAVFHGSLVHWEHLTATVDGTLSWRAIDPDSHWRMKLETAESVLREKGLTLIPPAAMKLHFGPRRLEVLLDPRQAEIFEAAREIESIAGSLLATHGIRSRPHAYQRLLDLLRFGHDPGTLVAVLENRRPATYAELVSWISERSAPFSWTRDTALE